ncbi:MAG: amidophosphoribosyltransferase [Armatimonadota bacterium]|nr:amidophosphoribosyltransferase [Armatimonadota bacterium]
MMGDTLKEECGVVGVYCQSGKAASLALLALHALQHRGQESAGIATSDGVRVWTHKGLGLVSQVFDPGRPPDLPGHLAVGHVRYSTTGSTRIENAQPLTTSSRWGYLALAHNGNLTNAAELRGRLEKEGSSFVSTTDSEVISHLIARAGDPTLEGAISLAMGELEGAYTVVLVGGGKLCGFCDPYGIRPLVVGEFADGYILASESCALDHVGARFVAEVEPGGLVVIERGQLTVHQAQPPQGTAGCVFEYIYFARPDTVWRGRNVHQARRHMGRILAREHPAEADVVVPVPDSGLSAAMGYAEATGIPLEIGLVKNRYIGRTFIQPEQAMRDFGVQAKLNPVREVVQGRRIVLVDDSIVRGTTSSKIVGLLRASGAREVHVRISSPPIRFPCFYGIDTSSRGELVAARLSVEEIQRLIGADSLGFLSQEGLVEALGLAREELCMACLDGRYPTRIPREGEAGRQALEFTRRIR